MHQRIIGEIANSDLRSIIGKQDFQKDIVTVFDTFFENKDKLATYSNDFLIQDYLNYKRNNLHLFQNALVDVYTLLQSAKSASEERTLVGLAQFQPVSVEMGNKHWSMLKLQNDFSKLESYEYVTECFTLIEYTCENLLKNLFALIVYLLRIIRGRLADFNEIKKMKFGNLLNEIIQSNQINSAISIVDSQVSISQWRNISCHKSYQHINGRINCQYGNNLDSSITLNTKEDLLCIAKSIYRLSQVILLPVKLFTYDNIDGIRNQMGILGLDTANFRDEDWELIFVTELIANGFLVLEITGSEKLCITLQDTLEANLNDRIVLIPIAAYKAWVLTGKSEVEIIYIRTNGKRYCSITLTSEMCEKVSNYEEDFVYLAEKMIVKKY